MKIPLFFLLILVAFLSGGSSQTVFSQEDVSFEKVPVRFPSPWRFPEAMEVTVLDEQERPLREALVTVTARQNPNSGRMVFENFYTREYRTDQEGKTIVTFDELAEKCFFTQLYIHVSADKDHISVPAFYRVEQSAEEIVVPDKLTVTLKRSMTQLFRVLDKQGNGIEGVEVTVFFSDSLGRMENYNRTIGMSVLTHSTKTDSNGDFAFLFTEQPDNIKNAMRLTLAHPEFQTLELSTDQLKRGESLETITLSPLIKVTGRVVDENRNPVSGAIVDQGPVFMAIADQGPFFMRGTYETPTPITITDEDGMFTVSVPPKQTAVRVRILARGMQTQFATLNGEEPATLQEITLKKGNPIRIRAIDKEGNVVPNITVQFHYQFQYETPITQEHSGETYQNLVLSSSYPVAGQYWDSDCWEWADGGKEEYFVTVMKPGENGSIAFYAEQPFYRVRPREEPYVVKMKEYENGMALPSLSWQIIPRMKIRVWDYETGLPCGKTQVSVFLGKNPDAFSSAGWYTLVQKEYFTNEQGEINLDFSNILPANVDHFTLTLQKDGYYGKSLQWSSHVLKMPEHMKTMASIPRHLEERCGPPVPELLELVLVPKEP